MINPLYVGNGAYCYANSTAMLLASIGEKISPSKIEVLTGVGLNASLKKNGAILYLNNQSLLPDLGTSKALEILGFQFKAKVFQENNSLPIEELKKDLKNGPAGLGPLDMGYLDYNPGSKHLNGTDHYVLAYKIDGKQIYLHDPAGFPFVFLSLDQLDKAWRAERISYRQGVYRYLTSLKRINFPTEEEIYNQAMSFFKSIYQRGEDTDVKEKWFTGKEAIDICAEKILKEGASEKEIGHFVHFALPLGAKRALDFAAFFEPFDPNLARLKQNQAELFGTSHTYAVRKDWQSLGKTLRQLAEVEEEIKNAVLSSTQ